MLFMKNKTISPKEAHEILGSKDDTVLLDVRTREEYKQMHIDGAKLIPVDEITQQATSQLPDKDTTILVYCQSGMRARTAVKQLEGMGYTNVVSFGGIRNWPYGTVKG